MWMTLVWFLLFVFHCQFIHSFGTLNVERNQKQLISPSFTNHHRLVSQLFSSSSLNNHEKATTTTTTTDYPMNDGVTSEMVGHHVAIKTRNIEMAIAFYSLLGFQVETKFRAGPAKAAWLQNNNNQRLEVIEVPSYMLPKKGISRAIDLIQHESLLGFNHLALNVTQCIQTIKSKKNESTIIDESCGCIYGLNEYMKELNQTSMHMFQKTLRVAVPPRQQIIGGHVYELSFIYDADGSLLELLYWTNELTNKQDSGWEPWDGKGFINGAKNNNSDDDSTSKL